MPDLPVNDSGLSRFQRVPAPLLPRMHPPVCAHLFCLSAWPDELMSHTTPCGRQFLVLVSLVLAEWHLIRTEDLCNPGLLTSHNL